MHPTRWGDPARAGALPETARGLVELVFPVADRAVPDERDGLAPAARSHRRDPGRPRVRGRRGARAHRRRRPAAAHPRQVDAGPAPRPRRRPHRRAGRRGPSRRPRRGPARARGRRPSPDRGRAVRRRDVGRRWTGRPSRGVRRGRQPRPGADEAAPRGRPRVDDRHPRAGPAGAGGRGAPGRARPHPRPLPAVLRVRHHRRLRGDPVERAVVRRLRPVRRARGRAGRRDAATGRSSSGTRRRAPPDPTCGSCSWAPRGRWG